MICRDDLLVTEVAKSNEHPFRVASEIMTEFAIFLVSGVNFPGLLVVVVYRLPRAEHFSKFLERISQYLALAPRCILAGDFNYDLSDINSVGHELVFGLESNDFQVIRFGETFFIREVPRSWIFVLSLVDRWTTLQFLRAISP